MVLLIYRRDRKTAICCESAKKASSAIPMHELLAFLPEGEFLSISRSAIVCRDRILNISHDGVYTMTDGKTFQGRTRYLSTHRREMNLDVPPPREEFVFRYCYQPEPGFCACVLVPEEAACV